VSFKRDGFHYGFTIGWAPLFSPKRVGEIAWGVGGKIGRLGRLPHGGGGLGYKHKNFTGVFKKNRGKPREI